jgi:hypothetical protein
MNPEDQPIDRATGKVRVCSERCKSCIFWADGRSAVAPEQAREVIEANLKADATLTCHSTLGTDAPAVCAGFWAKHRNDVLAGRIAQMLCGIIRLKPPEE